MTQPPFAEIGAWLEPMSEALGLPLALRQADGTIAFAVGELPTTPHVHPLTAIGRPVGELLMPCEPPAAWLRALELAIAAHADAQITMADMATALASAWKEANLMHRLDRRLQQVTEPLEAGRLILEELGRLHRDSIFTLTLNTPELVLHHPPGAVPPAPQGPVDEGLSHVEGEAAWLRIPLIEGDEEMGTLAAWGPASQAQSTHIRFLTGIAAVVCRSLVRSRLLQQTIQTAQLDREFALAASIQQSLLPAALPHVPDVALAARCRQAHWVGGDAYHLGFEDGQLDLLVADVSGHGVPASLLMSHFMSMVRLLGRGMPLDALATRLNQEVCRTVRDSGQFITAFYARLDPRTRRLQWISLGHPAPLLVRDARIRALPAGTHLPAGMWEEEHYQVQETTLEPGDRLLIFTDGLPEARGPGGAIFGQERLEQTLERAPGATAAAMLEGVFDACDAFSDGAPPADDQTAIVMALAPSAAARGRTR